MSARNPHKVLDLVRVLAKRLCSRTMRVATFCLVGSLMIGCAALRDDLRRAEAAFSEARYENAQVWLEHLEPNVPQMERPLRARFYYLTGMTAYRMGDKARARHYLALCREEASEAGLGLTREWQTNLSTALLELGAASGESQLDS